MFTSETLPLWKRAAQASTCVVLAAYMVYQGQTFPGPSMMPPLMCALTALTLALTALAIGFNREEETD